MNTRFALHHALVLSALALGMLLAGSWSGLAAVALGALATAEGLLLLHDLRLARRNASGPVPTAAPASPAAATDAAATKQEPSDVATASPAQEAAPFAPASALAQEPSPTQEAPSEQDAAPLTLAPTARQDEVPHAPLAPKPAPDAPVARPHRRSSRLDFAALSRTLTQADDPLDELKRFVGTIRTREAEGGADTPCDLERYAARLLEEAGLFDKSVTLPDLDVVRPDPSHMVYLRSRDARMPYGARLRIIKLEAALNAIRFACASLPANATILQAYHLNQGLARSIVAQAPSIDEPIVSDSDAQADGEWAVRYGISQAIETLQLPYRLDARFRTNVADGNVALEFDLTPADAFPSSALVEGVGIVPTTGDMRQRAAADYTLRVALLLAASAFRCSQRIRHVWVAAVHENGERRTCYLSVDFDRWRFARIDLSDLHDLTETYRSFAPQLRYEDGWLRPVRQGFHLEQERFCPSRRYLPVSFSTRRLEGAAAEQLGCDHVSALAIEEGDGRTLVANAIMMSLAPETDERSTQKNVRTVLELAADDPDPTVRSAAERVARQLVEGTLEQDALSVGEEFVRGDTLTRTNDRAKELLMGQKPREAHDLLAGLLAQIDGEGLYADSPHVAYRYFNSYVERTLFNRRHAAAGDRRTVLLVPDAYYEAHLLLSMTALMLGNHDEALAHADLLCALAPLDARSRLHRVQCLELMERDDEAFAQLVELLEQAHDPRGIGFAYYRTASLMWKRGDVAAAQACYQRALHFLPGAVPLVAMEMSVLYLQHAADGLTVELSDQEAEEVLARSGIPVAPTKETSEAFLACAKASLDAEIFPVARNFAHMLGFFAGDDIIAGLIRSLEDAPDH